MQESFLSVKTGTIWLVLITWGSSLSPNSIGLCGDHKLTCFQGLGRQGKWMKWADLRTIRSGGECGQLERATLFHSHLEGETSRFFNVRNHSVWCSYFAWFCFVVKFRTVPHKTHLWLGAVRRLQSHSIWSLLTPIPYLGYCPSPLCSQSLWSSRPSWSLTKLAKSCMATSVHSNFLWPLTFNPCTWTQDAYGGSRVQRSVVRSAGL